MPKITPEQAADQWIAAKASEPETEFDEDRRDKEAFLAGAAWERSQSKVLRSAAQALAEQGYIRRSTIGDDECGAALRAALDDVE